MHPLTKKLKKIRQTICKKSSEDDVWTQCDNIIQSWGKERAEWLKKELSNPKDCHGQHYIIDQAFQVEPEAKIQEMSELEKLAFELYSLPGAPLEWKKIDDDMLIKHGFMKIAKHVQRLMVEARIEEVKSWESMPFWARQERITELTEQFKEMK